jgi:RNA polymerase sigma factor (sigma-70 family)
MEPAFALLLQHLRRPATGSATDAELLNLFAREGDEDSFAELVARHGRLVWNVCRRTLRDAHEAEDAFQATFLVLARRAGALQRPERLAGWLYGVASRIARDAQRARRPQVGLDRAATVQDPGSGPLDELADRERLAILEEELHDLPESQRLAVVFCGLEGRSQDEAARQLGWTAGQVKGRLERGRKRLQDRLTRRGIGLSPALEAARGMVAPLAESLAGRTAKAGAHFVTGRALGTLCTVRTIALTEGVLNAMWFGKLKTIGAIAILSCATGGGAVLALHAASGSGSEPAGGKSVPGRAEGPNTAIPAGQARQPPPAPGLGAQPPLSRERLMGNLLRYHRTPPDEIAWEFSRDRFRLRVKGTPAPRDLLDLLLGKDQTAGTIEGTWQLSADSAYLELSEITGDGREGVARARLPIRPTGSVRVTIGERQYNVLPLPGGPLPVSEADVVALRLNHYFTPDGKAQDPDFVWTFTETEFVLKKGRGPIPADLRRKLLPPATTADEIRGRWSLEPGGRSLVLTKIRAGETAGPKQVALPIARSGGIVVRIGEPHYVFAISR